MTDDVKIPIEVDVDGAVSRIRDFGKAAETLAGNFESLGGATEKAAKAMAALVASHKVLASTRLNQLIYEINRYEQAIRKAAQAGQGLPGFGGGGGAFSSTASTATGGTVAAPMSPSSTPQRTAPYQDSRGRWHHPDGRFMADGQSGAGGFIPPWMMGMGRAALGSVGLPLAGAAVGATLIAKAFSSGAEGTAFGAQLDPVWRAQGIQSPFERFADDIRKETQGRPFLSTNAAEFTGYLSAFGRSTVNRTQADMMGGTAAGIGFARSVGADRDIGVAAAAAMDRWLKDRGGWKQTGALLAQGLVESHSLQQAGEMVGQFTAWLKSTGGSGAAPNADAYWDWITKLSQTKSPSAMGAEGGALLQQMDAGFRSNMDNPAFMSVFDRALKSQGINKDVYGIRRLVERGGMAEIGGPGSGTMSNLELFTKQFRADYGWMSQDQQAENIASLFGISRDQAATFLSAAANPGRGRSMMERMRGKDVPAGAWVQLQQLVETPDAGLDALYGQWKPGLSRERQEGIEAAKTADEKRRLLEEAARTAPIGSVGRFGQQVTADKATQDAYTGLDFQPFDAAKQKVLEKASGFAETMAEAADKIAEAMIEAEKKLKKALKGTDNATPGKEFLDQFLDDASDGVTSALRHLMSYDASQSQRSLLQDAALRDGALLWSVQHGGVGAGSWGGGFLRTSYTGGRVPLGFGGGWGGAGGSSAGGAVPVQASSASSLLMPLAGQYTLGDRLGAPRRGHLHQGIDLAAPVGTDILAAADGRVARSFHDKRGGDMVVIDHGGGRVTKYMHLDGPGIAAGSIVKQGQKIGDVGKTGRGVKGAHLHLELWEGGDRGAGGHPVDFIDAMKRDKLPPSSDGERRLSAQVQGTADVAVRVILDKDGRVASVEPPSRVRVPLTTGRSPHRGLA